METYSKVRVYWDNWDQPPLMRGLQRGLQRGDRVRVKEGYDRTGRVLYYVGKSENEAGKVVVAETIAFIEECFTFTILADAIEPYPYTREERIERAMEDLYGMGAGNIGVDWDALLFAILDAGV